MNITKSMVEQIGLHPVLAESAERGVEQFAANNDIKIILLDILMPEIDGFMFVDMLRQKNFPHRPVQFIAITADISSKQSKV